MKILCVLYDDPKNGMPEKYPIDELPKIENYPDGQTLPHQNQLTLNLVNFLDACQVS